MNPEKRKLTLESTRADSEKNFTDSGFGLAESDYVKIVSRSHEINTGKSIKKWRKKPVKKPIPPTKAMTFGYKERHSKLMP